MTYKLLKWVNWVNYNTVFLAAEQDAANLSLKANDSAADDELAPEGQEDDGDWEQVGPRNKSMVTRMVRCWVNTIEYNSCRNFGLLEEICSSWASFQHCWNLVFAHLAKPLPSTPLPSGLLPFPPSPSLCYLPIPSAPLPFPPLCSPSHSPLHSTMLLLSASPPLCSHATLPFTLLPSPPLCFPFPVALSPNGCVLPVSNIVRLEFKGLLMCIEEFAKFFTRKCLTKLLTGSTCRWTFHQSEVLYSCSLFEVLITTDYHVAADYSGLVLHVTWDANPCHVYCRHHIHSRLSQTYLADFYAPPSTRLV